jgi:hypothetical protein
MRVSAQTKATMTGVFWDLSGGNHGLAAARLGPAAAVLFKKPELITCARRKSNLAVMKMHAIERSNSASIASRSADRRVMPVTRLSLAQNSIWRD